MTKVFLTQIFSSGKIVGTFKSKDISARLTSGLEKFYFLVFIDNPLLFVSGMESLPNKNNKILTFCKSYVSLTFFNLEL